MNLRIIGAFILAVAVLATGTPSHALHMKGIPPSPPSETTWGEIPLMAGLQPIPLAIWPRPDPKTFPRLEAEGYVDVDQVYAFYQRTLTEHGWQEVEHKVFTRGRETLRLFLSSVTPRGVTRLVITRTLSE